MWIIPVAVGVGFVALIVFIAGGGKKKKRPLVYAGQGFESPDAARTYLLEVAPAVAQQGNDVQTATALAAMQNLGLQNTEQARLLEQALAPAPVAAAPVGYDPERARALAPTIAADIRENKYDYDRARLRAFQLAAGITVDEGLYGGESAGALRYYLGTSPPAPLFAPYAEKTYQPR